LKLLSAEGASIWIRIPVIGGVNDNLANMEQTAKFLLEENIAVQEINLLPYHNTGLGKYNRLQREHVGMDFTIPETNKLEQFLEIFKQYGFEHIKIGG